MKKEDESYNFPASLAPSGSKGLRERGSHFYPQISQINTDYLKESAKEIIIYAD
jgi:hypothetical protein